MNILYKNAYQSKDLIIDRLIGIASSSLAKIKSFSSIHGIFLYGKVVTVPTFHCRKYDKISYLRFSNKSIT